MFLLDCVRLDSHDPLMAERIRDEGEEYQGEGDQSDLSKRLIVRISDTLTWLQQTGEREVPGDRDDLGSVERRRISHKVD